MLREISSGGVLVQRAAEGWELAVIEPQTEASIVGESDKKRHKEILALPKGLIDPGEKPAQTARILLSRKLINGAIQNLSANVSPRLISLRLAQGLTI